ncbi:MAG: lipoate protein ligase C-terminal domain-containing protein [Thermosphaera sp.]
MKRNASSSTSLLIIRTIRFFKHVEYNYCMGVSLNIYYNEYKARKGLYKVKMSVDENNLIRDVVIMGDFFIYPEDVIWEIESRLKGTRFSYSDIAEKVTNVLKEKDAVLVGCSLEEFIKVFTEARPVE